MKRLVVLVLALGALAMLAAAQLGSASAVRAQTPPARFFGALTVNGAPAPAGTEIIAYIGDLECGRATTTDEGRYVLDVNSDGTTPGCGLDDADVRFVIVDMAADQTAKFQLGNFIALDLTVGGPPPESPPPAPEPETSPPAEEPPPADMPPAEEPPPSE